MVENPAAPAPRRQRRLRWAARLVEGALLLLALGVALRLRLTNLDAYTGSFDEGIRTQQLLLMAAGYRPFRDIFASQGPLLLDVLFPFYRLHGETLAAARSGVVVCSMVALLGAWWAARLGAGRAERSPGARSNGAGPAGPFGDAIVGPSGGGASGGGASGGGAAIAGPVGGLAAVLLLAISPAFLDGSRLALAEVPTIAPAVLAIGGLLAYRRSPRAGWLVASAACCALAVLIKPMALHVGAPLAVLLVLARDAEGRWPWRRAVLDLALYGAVVGAICAVVVLLLGPAAVWDNLGAYRTGAGSAAGANAAANLRLTLSIMRGEQVGLFALALVGALLGLRRRTAFTLALLAWTAAILDLFVLYGDLADKHIVYLVPPLALLAALGAGLGAQAVGAAVRAARAPTVRAGSGRVASATLASGLLGLLGIAAYLATVPTIWRADQYLLREAPKVAAERRGRAVDAEIAEIIRARTPPDGWVLADNPNAAFEARRKVIPYLVDTSGTRVDAGSLTAALATAYVQQYRPAVIVTWPRRLGKLDAFTSALPALGYRLERSYELGWRVYVRPDG